MKKILFISVSLCLFHCWHSAPASVAQNDATVVTSTTQEKVAVSPEDLPEAVQNNTLQVILMRDGR